MPSLEKQLDNIRAEEENVLEKIAEKNGRKMIECTACDSHHQIRTLTAVQTHHYIEPHGCNGGDYWLESGLEFICPTTDIVNRLLFNNYDIPFDERHHSDKDPEEQFKHKYKSLFKEVIDTHERRQDIRINPMENKVNNHYVDKHRRKFGLVERQEKD